MRQEKFEGPLELLLDLIEKEKIPISEISLAKVAEEYLAEVKSLAMPDPEELAGFLVIAVQLLLIKSRSLLPGLLVPVEEEQSIAELEERLRLLQILREAARKIQNIERQGRRSYGRDGYSGVTTVFYPPPEMTSPGILARAFADVVALIPKPEKLAEEKIKRIISLEERITHLRHILQDAVERGFSHITRDAKEKMEIVVSFLAILELAKDRFVDLRQEEPFSEIFVRKT
ncbi:MAG: segregation and condensation protein A [Parcubacteria group bacterium Greene0714_36]|nr:MAG: segregation and condensation protein A [Parcubacteria group bacterium Greene0714_36]